LNLDPTLPLVSCLPGFMNQVFLNLIVNAAHAIEAKLGKSFSSKGKISIQTLQVDNYVEIRISDTGTGIPEEIHNQIFNPFFTTKPIGKGTGQGLAIVYSAITDKHDGSISFETEIGKGTTFVIRLPLEQKRDSSSTAQHIAKV
jgi:two-component system, NtrC family, sensor kinase